jgi:tRNA nucleotidyltransferase (CCA-adding enzyme)
MQVYLVGGAVRDELLGRPVGERDWVVVGATPAELERLGYRAVGRDFPVFLHPESHEEYALARLERKVAPGYRGFTTDFSPTVTLEQDLGRRDLTINAMARDAAGRLVDPHGGQADLRARLLRHVSPAFAEDPVRILRVARFAARFADLGFTVAPETMALMRRMVESGEAGALVSERVWRELERALGEATPQRGLEVLRDSGALAVLLPEIGRPADAAAAVAALALAAAHSTTPAVRWAAMLAALTVDQVEAVCDRLRVPAAYRELALLGVRLAAKLREHGAAGARPDAESILGLLELADAFRRSERFEHWLELLALGLPATRTPGSDPVALAALLRSALARAGTARLSEEEVRAHRGTELGELLRSRRLAAVRALLAGTR